MKNYYLLVALFVMSFWQIKAQCDYSEDFEGYNNNDVPTDWTLTLPAETSAYGRVATNFSTQTKVMRLYSGNATAESGDLVLVSPMNEKVSDGNHRLSFSMRATNTVESSLIVGTMDQA